MLTYDDPAMFHLGCTFGPATLVMAASGHVFEEPMAADI